MLRGVFLPQARLNERCLSLVGPPVDLPNGGGGGGGGRKGVFVLFTMFYKKNKKKTII